MASIISLAVAPTCIKNACVEGEWFGYTSVSCFEEYHNGDGNSYREGDDDDDGGYDYAPAA
ncbi:hypothetical protein TSUD_286640 [Trifolium subterraneum]|uniref:Uncharacterized protein n=1 Tax=Trifolium subterraneum TaxID=3900 RepID=A0A2Z6LQE6_TRISU|nr:hypothetical protein TSUD_286640 [Trifolium subterraneum]